MADHENQKQERVLIVGFHWPKEGPEPVVALWFERDDMTCRYVVTVRGEVVGLDGGRLGGYARYHRELWRFYSDMDDTENKARGDSGKVVRND